MGRRPHLVHNSTGLDLGGHIPLRARSKHRVELFRCRRRRLAVSIGLVPAGHIGRKLEQAHASDHVGSELEDGAASIDGGGGGILEDVNGGNVVGVDARDASSVARALLSASVLVALTN